MLSNCKVELEDVSGDEREQHQTRRQLLVLSKPTRNYLGIPDDGVNVSFLHPRQAKHTTQERVCHQS